MNPHERIVKVRKRHLCVECGKEIKRGGEAVVVKFGERFIGSGRIKPIIGYYHPDCLREGGGV